MIELHLGKEDIDLVEKEVGWMNGVTNDLDTISVSIGWSKQALVGLAKEIGL